MKVALLLFVLVAIFAQDCTVNVSTLMQVATCLNQNMVTNTTSISKATSMQILEWNNLIDTMLRGTCPTSTNLPQYKITNLFQRFCILIEIAQQQQRKGWGTVIVKMDRAMSNRDVMIQAPHPLTDGGTVEQSMTLFENVKSVRAVLFAGATRYAMDQMSTCQSSNFAYDVAHNLDNLFHEATIQYFNTYKNAGKDVVVIQMHGMAETTCGTVSAYMSNGILNTETETLARLRANWQRQAPTWELYTPKQSGTVCNLNGETNVQGRFLNGNGNATINWCTTKASGASDRFIHIEQKRLVRDAYNQTIAAFSETFPYNETVSPTVSTKKPTSSATPVLVSIALVLVCVIAYFVAK